MINQPSPFKGLNIRIPSMIPIEGRGFIRLRCMADNYSGPSMSKDYERTLFRRHRT